MVRKISSDDLNQINDLGLKYDSKFIELYNIGNYIDNEVYLLYGYEICGKLVGFIIATYICEIIEIQLIFVDNEFRKQGIATQLIEYLTKYQHEKILLEVSKENTEAFNLYKKLNFNVIAERKKYYNGIDALVMERKC